jgi:hypothetical protein
MVHRTTGFAPLPPPGEHPNPGIPTAKIHFLVHPEMAEIQRFAQEQGWLARGFTVLAVPWLELHFTTDGWVTSRVLKSTDVPCPIINGWCYLPHVHSGQPVEFAVHAGITCRAPEDHSASRDQGALWFNNDGANYTQTAR